MDQAPPLCPLIPMGAMTGRPTKEQIRTRLQQYREVGIRQFMIYPRSGCEIPYMSEAWLELCRWTIECAEELDVEVWLYDEFNWPSGRCDGQVMAGHPEFRAKTLVGRQTPEGAKWTVTSAPEHVDVLNPPAIRRFIELTHERYAAHLGASFGRRVRGIFTDEPSFIYGRRFNGDGRRIELPYTEGLENDYAEATGRPLRADLARAMAGKEVEGLWPAFYGILGRRFIQAFFDPIRAWCDAHNLLFTGHLLWESPPRSAVKSNGQPLACLRRLSLPGIDEIHTRLGHDEIEWETLLMARYAAEYAGCGALAELFALGPVDMPFGKLRQMLWLTAFHGIDHHVLAVSPLDLRGNLLKRDYFTAFTPVQPWFGHLKLLAADSAVAAKTARTGPGPGVILRYPWTLACIDAGNDALGRPGPRRTDGFVDLIRALVANHWPVRLVDETDPLPPNALACVTMTPSGYNFTTAGQGKTIQVDGVQELLDRLETTVARPFRIIAGAAPGQLLSETFADGRIGLLNLTKCELRNVVIEHSGVRTRFDLPPRGVRMLDPSGPAARCEIRGPIKTVRAAAPRFRMTLDRSNLFCCRLQRKGKTSIFSCAFYVRAGCPPVRLLVRTPEILDAVLLDGVTWRGPSGPGNALPDGMAEFYRSSSKQHLDPGLHSIELHGAVDDAPYLPAAFLAGTFGVFENNALGPLPETVGCEDLRTRGLLHYAGRVHLADGEVDVPDVRGTLHLRLDTGEHIAEVRLDGRPLGVRAWAPFEWSVPPDCRGRTARLDIILIPSLGAIFNGIPETAGQNGPYAAYWPGTHAPLGVLRPPEWRMPEEQARKSS